MTYKTSLDSLAKVVTASISIIFAAIIVVQISLIKGEGNAVPIFTTVTLAIIYFGTFSFRPISYILTQDKLIIQRPLSVVKMERDEIKSVEQLNNDKLSWTVRTFGVSGLFGYFGNFRNIQLGNMTWYATRRKDKIVLVTTINNKKIILSPDEPEKFVAEFYS
ncbi:MAG: PH domain-containing protein [Ferruginibacter sp.]|nr:PH domain-containing protein [Ferruginibacter sp.]